jgi:hypothetical protein
MRCGAAQWPLLHDVTGAARRGWPNQRSRKVTARLWPRPAAAGWRLGTIRGCADRHPPAVSPLWMGALQRGAALGFLHRIHLTTS